jgi:hypothetical protein
MAVVMRTFLGSTIAIESHPGLTPSRRQEMLSALRIVARILGADPGSIAADPSDLRRRLAHVSHASAGLSRGRWNNVRSLTLSALKAAGIRIMPRRVSGPGHATGVHYAEMYRSGGRASNHQVEYNPLAEQLRGPPNPYYRQR